MLRPTFLATSASLSALALASPAPAQTPALMNLRIAATANDTYASAYFAQDMGFFTKAGLNVDLETMNNGAAITAALSAGSMDIGVATPVILANAYLHGLPVVIVAAGAISITGVTSVGLCVSANSTFKVPKDFEGKTIAVNALHTGTEVNFDAWLTQGGMDLSKVKLVEVTFSAMGQALQSGRIDGAVMTEPAMTVAIGANNVKLLADLDKVLAPEYVNSCWFAMRDFAKANPELIRRFQTAIYAAQKWANTHHVESATILAKYSKMDLALVQRMARAPFAESLKVADIQAFLDPAAKFGTISQPVSAAAMIYRP
ncbi:MAG TPA: ABC transporter substrate-binding protein [Candidatus Lustribacter sp.]|jgi:NitT/TauT family transport system substrate-binding protein|nr:ABC transporter substrate-binding protein [Candidatus Lustribacter sp.]